MLGLFRRFRLHSRPARPTRAVTRARLGLESLEGRANPTNMPPVITSFTAQEIGDHLFLLTGHVNDEDPSTVTITLGGSVQSCVGQTTTCSADGSFSMTVDVETNGTISATSKDNVGQLAMAYDYVSPTT